MEKIIVHTDGGSRGNPGPAAIGVFIQDASGGVMARYGETIGKAKSKQTNADVYMDSELIVRQLNGEYKIEVEHLIPFFIKIWNLKIDFAGVTFSHVPREKNKEADAMVNEALD